MPGDHMRRWSAADGVTTFRKPSNKANGNAFDHQGRILTCEHATSRVTRTRPDGGIAVLVTHWQGKELNSPNDIIVASDGRAYFTDPTYGRFAFYGVRREPELSFRGVYRLEPSRGTLELLADDFGQPNGLCLSLDERRLFVNDTERGHIRVLDLTADGRVIGSRVWATLEGSSPGGADGMKIDSAGNLFCTGPGGVHVFDAEGHCLGVILVPEVVADLHLGRRRPADPLPDRLDLALSGPRPGPRPARLLAGPVHGPAQPSRLSTSWTVPSTWSARRSRTCLGVPPVSTATARRQPIAGHQEVGVGVATTITASVPPRRRRRARGPCRGRACGRSRRRTRSRSRGSRRCRGAGRLSSAAAQESSSRVQLEARALRRPSRAGRSPQAAG